MSERLPTRRLFGKFLLVQMPVFAIAIVAGLMLLAGAFARDEQNMLDARVGNLAARIASLVASDVAQADSRQLESYLGVLMADTAIRCAELSELGAVIAAAPRKIGCLGQAGYDQLTLPIPSQSDQSLVIRFSTAEVAVLNTQKQQFTLMAIVMSLLVATVASWFAFSTIIGKPIAALLAAIRSSTGGPAPVRLRNPPADELGTVIGAFNDMQERIAVETDRRQRSLDRLRRVYDNTPGLMFTMADDGIITGASAHWLRTMGYDRADVVGRPLSDFIFDTVSQSVRRFTSRLGRDIQQLPLVLRSGDCKPIEVLLSARFEPATADLQAGFLCVMTDITSLNAVNRKLKIQAATDVLTGLPNRQAFVEHFHATVAKGRTALMFIDLDNFKWVNDTHGHDAGDAVLREAANRLHDSIGHSDFPARLGGDEFAVILGDPESLSNPLAVAQRIIAALNRTFMVMQMTTHIGCSIGIAMSQAETSDLSELMRMADVAMYKSKQEGRGRATVYSEALEVATTARAEAIGMVRGTIATRSLNLHFQPIVCLEEFKPCGAEALLRIDDAGSLAPADFIAAAEVSGLMPQVGELIVDRGLAACGRLTEGGSLPLQYLSVNLSPRQLDQDFMARFLRRLRDLPEVASRLVLEITETTLLRHDDHIAGFFSSARSLGTRIALDDFGTGYSSLSHLIHYPVDVIKFDRSFIRHIDDPTRPATRRNLALVGAACGLCRDLGIRLVAEGIETTAELEAVKALGFTYGQGYLFSPALPEAALRDWVGAFAKASAPAKHFALAV